jgi:hypothetical protein
MTHAEKKALRAERVKVDAADDRAQAQATAETAAIQAQIRVLEDKSEAIKSAAFMSRNNRVAFRDASEAAFWRDRPENTDPLISKIDDERMHIRVSRAELPEAPLEAEHVLSTRPSTGEIVREGLGHALAAMARTVSNGESCNRRIRALLHLRDEVRDAVCQGLVLDAAELESLFKTKYAQLPRIESVQDVLARDVRGRDYVAAAKRLTSRSHPPAA